MRVPGAVTCEGGQKCECPVKCQCWLKRSPFHLHLQTSRTIEGAANHGVLSPCEQKVCLKMRGMIWGKLQHKRASGLSSSKTGKTTSTLETSRRSNLALVGVALTVALLFIHVKSQHHHGVGIKGVQGLLPWRSCSPENCVAEAGLHRQQVHIRPSSVPRVAVSWVMHLRQWPRSAPGACLHFHFVCLCLPSRGTSASCDELGCFAVGSVGLITAAAPGTWLLFCAHLSLLEEHRAWIHGWVSWAMIVRKPALISLFRTKISILLSFVPFRLPHAPPHPSVSLLSGSHPLVPPY